MTKNKKLLLAGILIIIGGTLMRLAWVIIDRRLSLVMMIMGSILFLGGIVFFANTLYSP